MTILINQTPVGFTLTGETTLGDLEAALRSWADTEGQVITSLLADGRAVTDADPTPLETVATVEVEAVDRGDAGRARAEVLAGYLDLLTEAAARGDADALAQLRAEWPGVAPALGSRAAVLEAAASDSASLARAAAAEAGRLRRAAAPVRPLEDCLADLEAEAGGLSSLGTLFHQGRDREALEGLDRLFGLLEDLGRSAGARSPAGWREWHSEFGPFLGEIEASLAAGDLVLTADLLEYEVKPRLEELRGRIGL